MPRAWTRTPLRNRRQPSSRQQTPTWYLKRLPRTPRKRRPTPIQWLHQYRRVRRSTDLTALMISLRCRAIRNRVARTCLAHLVVDRYAPCVTAATSVHRDCAHRPHLHRDCAHPARICTGTGLTPATSAPGPRSPLPHLHRDSPRSIGPWSACACGGLGLSSARGRRSAARRPMIGAGMRTQRSATSARRSPTTRWSARGNAMHAIASTARTD